MTKNSNGRTSKTDPKGDRRSRTIDSPEAPVQLSARVSGEPNPLDAEAIDALILLLVRGDGWVRLTATLDMKTAYLKYKWTSGRNRGKYVMSVTTLDALSWGLCLLGEKVRKVDAGDLQPSKDTFYDWIG